MKQLSVLVLVVAFSLTSHAQEVGSNRGEPQPVTTAQATEVRVRPNSSVGKLLELNKASKEQLQTTLDLTKIRLEFDRLKKQIAQLQEKKNLSVAEKDALKKALDQVAAIEKEAAELKAKLKQTEAKTQAVAATGQGAFAGYSVRQALTVREHVDREKDKTERFMIMLAQGPVIIDLTMYGDSKPFRVGREELIDRMLESADKDENGKVTWEEAFESPKFTMGRIRLTNDAQKKSYLRNLDLNQNGEADRVEVRQFLSRYFGGSTFTLSSQSSYGYGRGGARILVNGRVVSSVGPQADIQPLLDQDKDGTLSDEEITNATERLKSRDSDDNDLLYPQEVTGTSVARAQYAQQSSFRGRPSRIPPLYYSLGPEVKTSAVYAVLKSVYKELTAKRFEKMTDRFNELDKDRNGKLDVKECEQLRFAKADYHLVADFKEGGQLKVNGKVAPKHSTSVELPGVKLTIAATIAQPNRGYDYSNAAKSYIDRYDGNKNGYIEKDEMPSNFAYQWTLWDLNRDGKVFKDEIKEAYSMMQAPQRTQYRASIINMGNPLFQTLDLSGDGRLSLREMKTAARQLAKFDTNSDSRITKDEIPQTIAINISRGTANYQYASALRRPGATPIQPPANTGNPAWFDRMDRNGDGDLTLKEFLGDKSQFTALDTNSDGFIEPAEAKAAQKSSSK